MQIYCKNCKKCTGNTFPKKLVPISKKNQNVLFAHEIEDKYDLKSNVKVYPKFFND